LSLSGDQKVTLPSSLNRDDLVSIVARFQKIHAHSTLVLLHAWNEIDELILANDARVAWDFGIFSLSMAGDFLRCGSIHVPERLRMQLIEPKLAFGPNGHESGIKPDDVVNLTLAAAQRGDDLPAGRICATAVCVISP
jgi:hypothetical protein